LTRVSVSEPLVQSVLLGDAIEHGPVAILVADEEMRYVAVNAFACELLGYSREELLGLRVTDVARYPEAPGEFDRMVAAGKLEGSTTLVRKDGSDLTMRYRASETRIAGLEYYVSIGWPEP
jgi:PAS domain S-box-containing protein